MEVVGIKGRSLEMSFVSYRVSWAADINALGINDHVLHTLLNQL